MYILDRVRVIYSQKDESSYKTVTKPSAKWSFYVVFSYTKMLSS